MRNLISNNTNTTTTTIRVTITILSLLMIIANVSNAQNKWLGGTPGFEQDWNTPKNWSENNVPDWTDDIVVIQDVSSQSGYFPIINQTVPEIPFLRIESGATLTIEKNGKLVVNGSSTYNYGILNVGKLNNKGLLSIEHTAMAPFIKPNENINNTGVIAIIEDSNNIEYLAHN